MIPEPASEPQSCMWARPPAAGCADEPQIRVGTPAGAQTQVHLRHQPNKGRLAHRISIALIPAAHSSRLHLTVCQAVVPNKSNMPSLTTAACQTTAPHDTTTAVLDAHWPVMSDNGCSESGACGDSLLCLLNMRGARHGDGACLQRPMLNMSNCDRWAPGEQHGI